eukprot:jgi/Ulvmu1/11365/UM075_0025.1
MSMLWSLLGSIWDALPSWRAPSWQEAGSATKSGPGGKRRRPNALQDLHATDMVEVGGPVPAPPKRMRSQFPGRASNEYSPTAHWRSSSIASKDLMLPSFSPASWLWGPVPDLRPHAKARETTSPPRTTIKDLQGLTCRYPDRDGAGVLTIEHHDLQSLEGRSYINDTIMDYYIKAIEAQYCDSTKPKMLFCNCFFYKKLTEGLDRLDTNDADAGLYGFHNIKRWTESRRVLDQDYIFVPIHGAMHWSLAVICHPGVLRAAAGAAATSTSSAATSPSAGNPAGRMLILHLEPLKGERHSTADVTANLSGWLRQECAREGLDMSAKGIAARSRGIRVTTIPRQSNSHDCGPYVLTYLEHFAANPPASVAPAAADSDELLCYFPGHLRGTRPQTRFLCKNWFPEHNPAALRVRIMRQLLQLLVEQAPHSSLPEPRRAAALAAVWELLQQLDVVDRAGRCYEPPPAAPALAAAPADPATEHAEADSVEEVLVGDGDVAEGDEVDGEERAGEPRPQEDHAVASSRQAEEEMADDDVAEVVPEGQAGSASAGDLVVLEWQHNDGAAAAQAGAGEDSGEEDPTLELERMVLALHGSNGADTGAGVELEGLTGESEELGALELWHPDDLWR